MSEGTAAVPGRQGIDSGIDRERETWIHRCMVEGDQPRAIEWLEGHPDFEQWTDRRGRTVAARVLSVLGDDRQSALRHIRNFRQYPEDPIATFYGAFTVHGISGPLAVLDLLEERLGEAGERAHEEEDYSGLWAYLGSVLASFRDFRRSRECFDQAEKLEPDDTWILVQRSLALLREDRPEESLEVAELALSRTPRYWPAIGTVVDRYWAANRDEEAFALLDRAMKENRGLGPPRRLAQCYDEIEDYERGLEALEEFERRCVRPDRDEKRWLAGYRASFFYQLGRGEEMVPPAKIADRHFYDKIVERVESGEFAKGNRVRLDVKFVRQNNLTCAPATLTALSQFFGRPADHLEIAEEICYDGTPDFKERLWAEQQGWTVREFRADWDTTRALIDAGIPFAVATVEPTSAHLQAMIGYDSRAGTVIIRDPGDRHYRESLEKPFYEDYAHSGPRAMALVPAEKADDLLAIDLPEVEEYDLVYRLNGALEEHDRERASEILAELETLSPDHRLVDHARLVLSYYDSDSRSGLETARRMAERFPDSVRCEYVYYRRRVAQFTRQERLDYLQEKVKGEKVFTLYYKELADLLSDDARCLPEARYYYRRALKFRRSDAEVYYGLAGVLWSEREFPRATMIYRLASCLADRDEANAEAYFKACRWVDQTEEGLAMLRERFERLGTGSGEPAITLCNALSALDRDPEIPALLDEALERSPTDGTLISYAARHFASFREGDRARALVDQAEGKISEAERRRLLARLASLDSRPEEALEHWREVAELEPLSMDAHRSIAGLLARTTDSNEASIAHLRQTSEEFPYHVGLKEALISWLRDEGAGMAEATLRDLLEKHPSNAWAWRELALDLAEQQRIEEGIEAARQGIDLQPEVTWGYSVMGSLEERAHRSEVAADSYRRALELDVENDAAMRGLVRVSDGDEAKRKALEFIEAQLRDQVLFGEALHGFRSLAFSILEPGELLAALRRARDARPDLWETWSSLVDQLIAVGDLDEAEVVAKELTERFPVMPRAWLDLADVYKHRRDQDREIETLEKCLELNPQWSRPLRMLADELEARGEFERAVSLLERAVREAPQEPANHGCLADLLWKTGRRDEAFEALLRAVRVDADYDWGWDTLAEWGGVLEREEEAIAEGVRLTETLPMKAVSWQRLANLYGGFDRSDERLETLEKGLEQLPRSIKLRDHQAWALCRAGRYEAAMQACRADLWPEGQRPRTLAGREAWIENERGNREGAIEKMEVVATQHSDYYWAHEMLGDWYLEAERWEDAERQARHLIRLEPTEPVPHGTLANLLMKREKDEEARESFERAFQLSPSYAFAGYHLTRLNLEADRLDQAEAALEVMEYHHPEMAACGELRSWLAFRRKRPVDAQMALAALCRQPEVAVGLLERVEEKFAEFAQLKKIANIYQSALESGEVRSPSVARRWVCRRLATGRPRSVEKTLVEIELRPEVAEGAWQELLYELENLGRGGEAVAVLRRHPEVYRSTSTLWASGGYVLRQVGRHRELRKWMSDWREREGVMPWMLINAAFSELRLKGIGAAGPVHQYAALELPEDHDTWCHHACASYYELWRGNPEAAKAHLERSEYGVLGPIYRLVHRLAEFRLETAATGKTDGQLFRQALEAFPEWAKNKSARIYLFDTLRSCGKELFLRPGARKPALGALMRATFTRAE